MRSVVALLLLAVVACGAAPLLHANNAKVVNGSYIVVLKETTTVQERDAHILTLRDTIKAIAEDTSVINHVYKIDTFVGFSAILSEPVLKTQLTHPNVLYVEADQVMTAIAVTQTGATWGLARIDEKTNTGGSVYSYNSTAGSGVDVYVIDTGIYTSNTDFGGRASVVYNAISGESSQDLNGHGTHCAGTIGGTKYGVAKQATLYGVKVLDQDGSGTTAGVIAGVNYVTSYKSSSRPSVASMSLGGGASTSLDSAVTKSIAAGVVYAVAAGNEDTDACDGSPARVPAAVTVGATDSTDTRAYFSNYGTCVDIFAPGVSITSDWIGSTTATNTISGTSMATPHVAGVLALHLSSYPSLTPAQSAAWVVATGIKNLVSDPQGSPNVLLYSPAV